MFVKSSRSTSFCLPLKLWGTSNPAHKSVCQLLTFDSSSPFPITSVSTLLLGPLSCCVTIQGHGAFPTTFIGFRSTHYNKSVIFFF